MYRPIELLRTMKNFCWYSISDCCLCDIHNLKTYPMHPGVSVFIHSHQFAPMMQSLVRKFSRSHGGRTLHQLRLYNIREGPSPMSQQQQNFHPQKIHRKAINLTTLSLFILKITDETVCKNWKLPKTKSWRTATCRNSCENMCLEHSSHIIVSGLYTRLHLMEHLALQVFCQHVRACLPERW